MSKYYLAYMDSIIGPLGIIESEGQITHIFFPGEDDPKELMGESSRAEIYEEETPLLRKAKCQLAEYFAGKRLDFDLPLKTEGTDFQKAAWKALLEIPYGEVRSYKQQAEKVGSPRAFRAVGMANNRNPIAIVIPCHRVIGSDGRLVGYGGGLHIKEALLELERKVLEKQTDDK